MADLEEALDLLKTAADLMGVTMRSPEDQRATAERVHAILPGVPLHHALASVQTLEAMGWKSPPAVRDAVAAERERICAVLGNDHYAIFTSLTWEVEHSTECALSGQVAECPHHKAIARIAEEYSEPGTWGRWLITGIDGAGLPVLERAEGEGGT